MKPRRLMNQLPTSVAEGSTKMHDPAAPTKNPAICQWTSTPPRAMEATEAARMVMAMLITSRMLDFVRILPAMGVTSVVPMK